MNILSITMPNRKGAFLVVAIMITIILLLDRSVHAIPKRDPMIVRKFVRKLTVCIVTSQPDIYAKLVHHIPIARRPSLFYKRTSK